MKMKLLQKKGSSLAAMFTAVIIACLGLAQQCEAQDITYPVDIKFMSQDGSVLVRQVAGTITTDGTLGSVSDGNISSFDLTVFDGLGSELSVFSPLSSWVFDLALPVLTSTEDCLLFTAPSGGLYFGRLMFRNISNGSRFSLLSAPGGQLVLILIDSYSDRFVIVADPTDLALNLNGLTSGCDSATVVDVDIKPGSAENTVNLGSKGVTKVAILGSDDFNATEVDPLSVELADATVRVKGNGQPLTTIQDTNGDGFLDLVLHVDTEGFTLTDGDVSAELTGSTFGGDDIFGEDVVRVVP